MATGRRIEKIEEIKAQYQAGLVKISQSAEEWEKFLVFSARNYRLPFENQVLAYAAKPDATALLTFEGWQEKFGRQVMKGTNGVAFFTAHDRSEYEHYFDITDTVELEGAREVPIWTPDKNDIRRHIASVFYELCGRIGDISDYEHSTIENAMLYPHVRETAERIAEPVVAQLSIPAQKRAAKLGYRSAAETIGDIIRSGAGYALCSRLDEESIHRSSAAVMVDVADAPEDVELIGKAASDITRKLIKDFLKKSIEKEHVLEDNVVSSEERQGENHERDEKQRRGEDRTEVQGSSPARRQHGESDGFRTRAESELGNILKGADETSEKVDAAIPDRPNNKQQAERASERDRGDSFRPEDGALAADNESERSERGASGEGLDGVLETVGERVLSGTESGNEGDSAGDGQPVQGRGRPRVRGGSSGRTGQSSVLDSEDAARPKSGRDEISEQSNHEAETETSPLSQSGSIEQDGQISFFDNESLRAAQSEYLDKKKEHLIRSLNGIALSGDKEDSTDAVRSELAERGFAVSDELIEVAIEENAGAGDFQDIADYIENEYLSEEAEFDPEQEYRERNPDIFAEQPHEDWENAAEDFREIDGLPPKNYDGVDAPVGAAHAEPELQTANFRITNDELGYGGEKQKYAFNIEAIRTLKTIEAENRAATPEEQEILSKYVGWGGIASVFDENADKWGAEYRELRGLLSEDEYEQARATVLNAHYTSPTVIKAMYEALGNLGFTGGNVLEPSCGIGNFMGLMPEDMASASSVYGVEIDPVSARIAGKLYPENAITNSGFEKTDYPDNFFDVAIGNVPFGGYSVADRRYDKNNFFIHDYFFAKTLDKVRPGGVVAFITSKGTLDKKNSAARKYLAKRAELLGAIRLPNNAFLKNAGTGVTSDIIFLKKRERISESEVGWTGLGKYYTSKSSRYEVQQRKLSDRDEPYYQVYDTENDTYCPKSDERRWEVWFENRSEAEDRAEQLNLTDSDFLPVNKYFEENPHMILGKMTTESSMYGRADDTTCEPIAGAELTQQLAEAIRSITGSIGEYEREEEEDTQAERIPADPSVRNFTHCIKDGEIYFRENSFMTKSVLTGQARDRLVSMMEIARSLRELIKLQVEDYPDEDITAKREETSELYDKFRASFGGFADKANAAIYRNDSSHPLLCSLDKFNSDGAYIGKNDILLKRTMRPAVPKDKADTPEDALVLSIAEKAEVDLSYMSGLLSGKSEKEIFEELKGEVFYSAASGTFHTADEFLSGNIREKLANEKAALEADPAENAANGILSPAEIRENASYNIAALTQAMPEDIPASEISVRLGSVWIPPRYVQQFIYELLDTPHYLRDMGTYRAHERIRVSYSGYTAAWEVSNKTKDYANVAATSTYGTKRINAYQLIEQTLNLKDAQIFDTVIDEQGKETRVLNRKRTIIARQKQDALRDAFSRWIFADSSRRADLVRIYNDRYNSCRMREYNGDAITFGGMNSDIELHPHQKAAVARVLYGGNTLLAHVVGAGKTFEMVSSAMESKRLGLCTKSLFVVPNHITEQWASEFLTLYPGANIIAATEKDFEMKNRKKFCSRIATGDYDAVIIGHSQFEKIPVSVERKAKFIEDEITEITNAIEELKYQNGQRFTVKQFEKTKKSLEARLEKLYDSSDKDDVVTFEELGIDRLFIDEAHYYKNLAIYTKMHNVAGVQTTESKKSSDLLMKCRYLDEMTGGKGIVFATGTPISNSMTELYTMQRYLQYEELKRQGSQHFDAWASAFGETVNAVELSPDGTGYRTKTRFSKFFNLPELMSTFKQVADIKTADMLDLDTPDANYHTVTVKPSETQKEMVKALSERAEKVRDGGVDPTEDNMLVITNDGRKIALDERLINPLLTKSSEGKIATCAKNVHRIYEEGKGDKLTQLVFCDMSTPKGDGTFNAYDEMKSEIVNLGIPEDEIAFIHTADTKAKKKAMFGKVKSGSIRVLMGSTQKMGAGTNVQDRLIAIHDLDCPWRPSDLEQRAGRIVRQGNSNKEVDIYRYVTEGTFDAYLYQIIENKQKFISQIMTSHTPVRQADDIDEAALSYAEIKALATGNPHIKEKMELDLKAARLKIAEAAHLEQRYMLEDKLSHEYPASVKRYEELIAGYKADIALYASHRKADGEFPGITLKGKHYSVAKEAGEALILICKSFGREKGVPHSIGDFCGMELKLMLSQSGETFTLYADGEVRHSVTLGEDARGNITRLENELAQMPEHLEDTKQSLDNTRKQQENAKVEIQRPFDKEDELKQATARLAELNTMLDMDGSPKSEPEDEAEDAYESAESMQEPSIVRERTGGSISARYIPAYRQKPTYMREQISEGYEAEM